MAQRVGTGVALLFHDHDTRSGWVVSSTPWSYFTPGKDPVLNAQEAGWAPGPVWTGGKSRPTGFRSSAVQPVVSRYTDWATRPTFHMYSSHYLFLTLYMYIGCIDFIFLCTTVPRRMVLLSLKHLGDFTYILESTFTSTELTVLHLSLEVQTSSS